jgi:hypothetical protein
MANQVGASRSNTSFSAPKAVFAKASKLPLLVSLLILAIGATLLVVLPEDSIALGLAAYFLSALGPTVCLGWDSVSQRKGMKSPGFSGNRTQTRVLQLVAIGGILIATFHMFRVADDIAEVLTELWGLA